MAAWLESAWIARYLDRQLDADEVAWFEAYMLDKPNLLDALEADTRLRDALHELPHGLGDSKAGASFETDASADASGEQERTSHRQSVRALQLWGAAASLAIGVGAGWLAHRGPSIEAPDVVADPTRIVVDTLRGVDDKPRIDHASTASRYLLVDMAVPPDATNVEVSTADGSRIRLHASADGFVSFLISRGKAKDSPAMTLTYNVDGTRIRRTIDLGAAETNR
jgi:hypothetical protein